LLQNSSPKENPQARKIPKPRWGCNRILHVLFWDHKVEDFFRLIQTSIFEECLSNGMNKGMITLFFKIAEECLNN
jgi:hypothetical protein